MKTTALILLAGGLATLTFTTLAESTNRSEQPANQPAKPRIEVCFVLDTTGSMSGLIEGAKQKIWSIANEMVSAKPTPEIRVGLVAYRDRGDAYIVKTFDLSSDIDAVYANLQGFSAGGGGDTPESVNEALYEAVHKLDWSQDRSVLKVIFLVGDAPPHMDYNTPKYPEICQAAMKKDLIINTVQCGSMAETIPIWKAIAQLGEGSYVAIAQSGGMVAIATPMDAELAELNRQLGKTIVAYGGEAVRRSVTAKQMAAEAAPAAVSADRLTFNARYGVAVQGEGELLDSLASGKLTLSDVKKDQLPTDWQKLSEAELAAKIAKQQAERSELKAQILRLGQARDAYLAKERQRLADAGKGDSFDEHVSQAIRAQAARKNIEFGK